MPISKPEFYHFPSFGITFCSTYDEDNPTTLTVTYALCSKEDKYSKKSGREVCLLNLKEGKRLLLIDSEVYKHLLSYFIRKPLLKDLPVDWSYATHETIRDLFLNHFLNEDSPIYRYWSSKTGYNYKVLDKPLEINLETYLDIVFSLYDEVEYID